MKSRVYKTWILCISEKGINIILKTENMIKRA